MSDEMRATTDRYRGFGGRKLLANALENPVESRLETRFHLLAIQDVKSYTCCVMDGRQL